MEFDISELLEESMKIEGVDRKKVVNLLVECIREKCDERKIYECIYKEVYKNNITPEMCEKWISIMKNEERNGAIWSLEDTNSIARRLDYDFSSKPYSPEEFRLMMTKEYYAHNIPLKKSGVNLEPVGWGRIADYYFVTDKNSKCDLIDKFFYLFK